MKILILNKKMNLIRYYKEQFQIDFKKLKFERPNSTILSNPELFKIDNNTIYFGGPNLENIINDTNASCIAILYFF